MAMNLSAVLKKCEEQESVINLNELKDYNIVLKYPTKIKKGDIVLNAGLTDEIYLGIYNNRFTQRFLSEVYGIHINKELHKSSNLYELYKSAVSSANGKTGLDRVLAISASVYLHLHYRMREYTDSYSKAKGILTNTDLLYLSGNNKRDGKAINIDYSLIEGPFLCHEFAITLSILLDKEIGRTGLKPFYVMGIVEKEGEKVEHSWIELRGRKGDRILMDPISNVVQPMKEGQNHVVSANGLKYWIDNGPLILRKSRLSK